MAKRRITRKTSRASTKTKSTAKLTTSDKKTLTSITSMAGGVVTAADRKRDPYVDIPSRTLSNVHYSPRKRILEMGKNKNRRLLFNLSQAKAYMQTMLVANGCKDLIDEGKGARIYEQPCEMGQTDCGDQSSEDKPLVFLHQAPD